MLVVVEQCLLLLVCVYWCSQVFDCVWFVCCSGGMCVCCCWLCLGCWLGFVVMCVFVVVGLCSVVLW